MPLESPAHYEFKNMTTGASNILRRLKRSENNDRNGPLAPRLSSTTGDKTHSPSWLLLNCQFEPWFRKSPWPVCIYFIFGNFVNLFHVGHYFTQNIFKQFMFELLSSHYYHMSQVKSCFTSYWMNQIKILLLFSPNELNKLEKMDCFCSSKADKSMQTD